MYSIIQPLVPSDANEIWSQSGSDENGLSLHWPNALADSNTSVLPCQSGPKLEKIVQCVHYLLALLDLTF